MTKRHGWWLFLSSFLAVAHCDAPKTAQPPPPPVVTPQSPGHLSFKVKQGEGTNTIKVEEQP